LRVFDAAEKIFADKGFDGATIRDIAALAGEPVGSVHYHGGGKEGLFLKTVKRRSETLSQKRGAALAKRRADSTLTLEVVIDAFVRPFFELSRQDAGWRAYARIVAYVSADSRWRAIAAECFDPMAKVFLLEIMKLAPNLRQQDAAQGFVFMVSAMLALLTSHDRITALGGAAGSQEAQIRSLVRYCAAGFTVVGDPDAAVVMVQSNTNR
jgi:AcrR family transcriptional regulator